MQSHGLSKAYFDNMLIRSVIRNMMALALVPEQHVRSLFDGLGEDLTDNEQDELSELLKYFDTYWMRQVSFWNVFNISDRTNNFSEGKTTSDVIIPTFFFP